ncbi:hypothetical protein JCM13580A_25420 [Streptomyces drozdowiczii]
MSRWGSRACSASDMRPLCDQPALAELSLSLTPGPGTVPGPVPCPGQGRGGARGGVRGTPLNARQSGTMSGAPSRAASAVRSSGWRCDSRSASTRFS